MEIFTLYPKTTYIDCNGYKRFTYNGKLVHREVAEKMLGRRLRTGEVVHHKDRNKLNNDPSNLWVFPSQKEHDRIHRRDAWKYGREASYRGFQKGETKDVTISKQEATLGGNKIMSQFRSRKTIASWLGWLFLSIGVIIYYKPGGDGFAPNVGQESEKMRRTFDLNEKKDHHINKHSIKRHLTRHMLANSR
jgi:hypothetical protein